MKKIFLSFACASLAFSSFAGGLQHNSNQSAEYVRMMSRNGSTSGDAVFYNLAGTALFNEGFTISLNNQSVFQTRTIDCDYPLLQNGANKGSYEGDVTAPLFPGVYAAYKLKNLTFSFGFNPIGGGGASTFSKGLPMLEVPIATVAQMAGASAYSMDMMMEGSSIYYGYQIGAAYKINEMFSVAVGVRIVDARNSYDGHLKNIQFNVGGSMLGSSYYANASAQTGAVATQLQPILGTPAAGATLDQMVTMGQMTQAQADMISGGLVAAGVTYNPAMTMQQIQGAYATVSAQTGMVAGAMADKQLATKQHGVGYTPILGVNFHHEKLNVGLKYEFRTKIELTNDTKSDVNNMFPDGQKTRSDLSSVLTAGAEYTLFQDKLRLSGSFGYFFDSKANLNGREAYVDDTWEAGFGAEYAIMPKLLVSAGYQRTQYSVEDAYETDISQALTSNTVGFGGAYKFNDMIKLNLGFLYTKNEDRTVPQTTAMPPASYNTTYGRHTLGFALGLDFTF